MITEIDVTVLAWAGGILGGVASFMQVAYGGFKTIPSSPPKSKVARMQRIYFLLTRLIAGGLVAYISSFWFSDNVQVGSLSRNKFVFISAIVGYSGIAFLSALKWLRDWFGH